MPEEPAKADSAATLPESPNPQHAAQMLQAALSGDASKGVEALEKAGVLPPGSASAMKEEEAKAQQGRAILSQQIAQNTEAVRYMAHAMDLFRTGVHDDLLKIERRVEMIERALEKLVDGFKDVLTAIRLRAELDSARKEIIALKAKLEASAGPGSPGQPAGSPRRAGVP